MNQGTSSFIYTPNVLPHLLCHIYTDTPVINDHPQPQILEVGQKLFLTCQASGPGTLEYQWFRNGEALIYGTKQELVIPEVQMGDQGVYVCCIKSNNGSSTLSKGAEIIGRFSNIDRYSMRLSLFSESSTTQSFLSSTYSSWSTNFTAWSSSWNATNQ